MTENHSENDSHPMPAGVAGEPHAVDVFDEVRAERARQDAKWGEQNHPNLSPMMAGESDAMVARMLGVPTHVDAREWCQEAFRRGVGSYAEILVEEVAEVVAAAAEGASSLMGDPDMDVRYELLQVAAVAVAWIEAIDRRRATPKPVDDRVAPPPEPVEDLMAALERSVAEAKAARTRGSEGSTDGLG